MTRKKTSSRPLRRTASLPRLTNPRRKKRLLRPRQAMRNHKRLYHQTSPRPRHPQRPRNPASSKPNLQQRSQEPVARPSPSQRVPAKRTSLSLPGSQPSHSNPTTSPPQHNLPQHNLPKRRKLSSQVVKKSQPSQSQQKRSPLSNKMARRQPPMATLSSQKLEMTRYLPASLKRGSSISFSELASTSRILRTSTTSRAAT